jgi:CRISPR system Cascade subunit CasA
MNLLQDPWMPVRDAQGRREWIAPDRLSEPQWRAFDADRPDFNGALAQFGIGLLQTTTPVQGTAGWRGLFREPPSAQVLRQWFEPVTAAFELDGEGPRFMQDMHLGTEGAAVNGIGALLIDSPGEQTLKNNADHFVKRSQVECLCPPCAATALFTLQLNAPAGGAGHRTGLRGGGPLTTLVLAPEGSSLWQHLWLNVADQPAFSAAHAGNTAAGLDQRSLPWLGPISQLQPPTGQLALAQVHPSHHFWAMPRRVHLHFGPAAAGSLEQCDLCGRTNSASARRYSTKNYGLNYKGEWNHPLSPYYQAKEGWLPLHPQPDGLGFRHWLAWVLGVASERRTTRVAPVVNRAIELLRRQTGPGLRLWAFGYDMDNMKARCWYESTLPIYGLADCEADAVSGVQAEVGRWLAGAEQTCQALRGAIRDAWFNRDARGDYAHVDAAFWTATEAPFYAHLRALIESARSGAPPDPLPTREAWHRTLVQTALHVFDEVFVGTGQVERQNPRRTAQAHRQLLKSLYGPKLKQALGLPLPPPTDKPKRGGKAKVAEPRPKEAA